ncbi:MAG: ATP-binding protein [Clostridiales bacterium]|nr:MAG: ATP-binding protein [Clostridiales bacterium]
MILYGSAGNGKTLFTKVLARECDLPVYIVDTADAKDESSIMQQIKNAFDKANDSDKRSVVFFSTKSTSSCLTLTVISSIRAQKRYLHNFLTLIDGINSTNNVFFVATCNDFDDLPPSMVRPGRIDKKIMLQNPDYGARKEIAEKYMFATKCEFEMSVEDIAELTQGLSCSAIETLINACVLESDAKNFVSTKTIYKNANEIRYCDIERDFFPTKKKYMKKLL